MDLSVQVIDQAQKLDGAVFALVLWAVRLPFRAMSDICTQEPAVSDQRHFFDRLVHDLREPLRTIEVYSELLNEESGEQLTPESRKSLTEILRGASQIRKLVDSISNYAIALIPDDRKSEASVQLALRIVTANLKGQIEACHAQVISQDPLPKVNMSLERLIQLLQCILENALKFGGDRPPILRVSAERDEDDRWVICVEDNGLGIDPDDVAMVFRPFERLNGSEYPGAGLGLTICRTIVESHGGHIWIDPRPRAGTMICFSVPGADP